MFPTHRQRCTAEQSHTHICGALYGKNTQLKSNPIGVGAQCTWFVVVVSVVLIFRRCQKRNGRSARRLAESNVCCVVDCWSLARRTYIVIYAIGFSDNLCIARRDVWRGAQCVIYCISFVTVCDRVASLSCSALRLDCLMEFKFWNIPMRIYA